MAKPSMPKMGINSKNSVSSVVAARIKGISQSVGGAKELARLSKIPHRTLNNYIHGRNEPRASAILAIAEAGGVSPEWLFGLESEEQSAGELGEDGDFHETFALVPVHSVRASLGYGAAVFEKDEEPENVMAFRRDWLRTVTNAPEEKLSCVYAQGESNHPEIKDRDLLLIDRSITDVNTEGAYAVSLDNFLLVKQVRTAGPGKLELKPMNPNWGDPTIVNLERLGDVVAIVGKVIWLGRTL